MDDLTLYKERYRKERLLNSLDDISEIANALKEDGSWEDIAYTPNGNGLNHTTRILHMAKAYANPSHSRYQDRTLLDRIILALNDWTKKVCGFRTGTQMSLKFPSD